MDRPARQACRIAAALLALSASGCITTGWGDSMDRATMRRRGPPEGRKGPYQPFGDVMTAAVSGAPSDFFRVPDLIVLDEQGRWSRDMVVVLPRGGSRLPALLLTPSGGDVARAAEACWRSAGLETEVARDATPAVPAMVVVAEGEDVLRRVVDERTPDRPWPKGYWDNVILDLVSPAFDKRTPWTVIAVRLDARSAPVDARMAVWRPGSGAVPGAWSWGPPAPVRDCLERSSGWPQFWKGVGYFVTVPLDIVTFPLQIIINR